MDHLDRQRYPRYETEVAAAIFVSNQEIEATMIDIGAGGIGVISEKAITPGAEVLISLKLEANYAIMGNVVWSLSMYDKGKIYYRTGIEMDCIILEDINAMGFSERTELFSQLLSEINVQGLKVVEKS
jgi:hypothetical protein